MPGCSKKKKSSSSGCGCTGHSGGGLKSYRRLCLSGGSSSGAPLTPPPSPDGVVEHSTAPEVHRSRYVLTARLNGLLPSEINTSDWVPGSIEDLDIIDDLYDALDEMKKATKIEAAYRRDYGYPDQDMIEYKNLTIKEYNALLNIVKTYWPEEWNSYVERELQIISNSDSNSWHNALPLELRQAHRDMNGGSRKRKRKRRKTKRQTRKKRRSSKKRRRSRRR